MKELKKFSDEFIKRDDDKFMFYLRNRWEDEKEYEDFADYAKAVKDRIDYVTITKVNKKPFGFKFVFGGSFATLKVVKKGKYLCIDIVPKLAMF